jgi:excinuclease UvrABC nuclease subunit
MIMIYAGKTTTAIYAICIDGHIAYVGKSRDLRSRADNHRTKILNSEDGWYPLARDFHQRGHVITMKVLATPPYCDLDKTEKEYIHKLKPLFNY